MAPAKRQKTGENLSATTKHDEPDSSTPHENGSKDVPKKHDIIKLPPYEYICFSRPQFDYEAENRILDKGMLEPEELEEKFEEEQDKAEKVALDPAKDHPDWKWVVMLEGWKKFCDYRRRSSYCCPDLFDLEMYNDHEGWGLQELVENWMLDFDSAFKMKDDESSRYQMWSVISGLGLWFNVVDMGPLYGCEDGDKTKDLGELVGSALLTTLASLDKAEELKPDSTFVDLAKVITEYLEWSTEHEAYGIDDQAVTWRPNATAYFKKAKLETSSGLGSTKKLLEEFDDDEGETKDSGTDPWGWAKTLKKYKKNHGPKIGGTHYDITKMSRKERADASYNGVDPLKDVSLKDLKEGNLDFA